jgi:hypothetical protein
MAYLDIVTALAVLQFVVFGFKVAMARERYGVKAPAIAGNEIFERHFRVQQNTLEQLLVFLPGLYLFSRYFNPIWGAVIGVVYLAGREIYSSSYVKNPASRSLGFALSMLPAMLLVAGGLIGAVLQLFGR